MIRVLMGLTGCAVVFCGLTALTFNPPHLLYATLLMMVVAGSVLTLVAVDD